MPKVKMGNEVEDLVTGFTGHVVEEIEYLNGCIQFLVTPHVDETKPQKYPESKWIDWQQLEYKGKGLADKVVKAKPKFKLGQVLVEEHTGFTGTAVGVSKYLNGNVQYGIKPKAEKESEMPKVSYLYQDTLIKKPKERIRIPKSTTGSESHPDAPSR